MLAYKHRHCPSVAASAIHERSASATRSPPAQAPHGTRITHPHGIIQQRFEPHCYPRRRDQQGDAATYLPRARRGPARPDRSPRCAPRPAAASALDPDPARPHLRNRPRGEPRPRCHRRRRRRAGGRRWRAAAAARRSSPLLRVQCCGEFARCVRCDDE
jgi:hypothetical protein